MSCRRRKEREKERERNVGKGEKRDKSVELCDLIFIFVTRKAVRENFLLFQ